MDAYLGEIRMFAGPYAPENWSFCDGSHVTISGNETLYSLIGTTYGGDGVTDFALPDLRSRVPIGTGQGAGLTNRTIGQTGGAEVVTLTAAQAPAHNHALNASTAHSSTTNVGPTVTFATNADNHAFYAKPPSKDPTKLSSLAASTVSVAGGSAPHDNRMPYLSVNYIICRNGLYPNFD